MTGDKLPAIALTAFVRIEDESDAIEAGYQLHLSQPVNADVLIAAVVNPVGLQPTQSTAMRR